MTFVFAINPDRTPSEPLTAAASRVLLRSGKAAVFKRYPFTLILKEHIAPVSSCRIKLDPGSKTTGIAILNGDRVIWAGELWHRGQQIRSALASRLSLRRGRRSRKTRYRKARFLNRTRGDRWIPPSIRSRVHNTTTWVRRLMAVCPITDISMESVRFDTQKLDNPTVSGIEYQQGTLHGYEVREYLLEKWGRKCAYCGVQDVPLQVEHIHPRSKGGSNAVRNLAIACQKCNQAKGNKTLEEFLKRKPEVVRRVLAHAKAPLKDAAAVNVTRRFIYRDLMAFGVSIECGSGGRTKFNRCKQNLPKTHWLDAACVGASTPERLIVSGIKPLTIKATGYGTRKMQQNDKYGFPKGTPRQRCKTSFGFKTGDMAIAIIPAGKYAGRYVGRVTIRSKPNFTIQGIGTHPKYLQKIHMADGYNYDR